MYNAPCQNCNVRFEACHDSCISFRKYRNKIEKINKENKEEQNISSHINDNIYKILKKKTRHERIRNKYY